MRNPVKFLSDEYEELVEKSLDWRLKTLQGPSEPVSTVDGKEVIVLCSNNYLGLTTHPRLKEAALEAIETHGVGSGAVRAISGTMNLHMELEERLAKFKGAEAALTYPTGFMVNSGLIPQLAGRGDLIVSDELNHGSIIDGVRLTRADRAIYKHNDTEDLARVLDVAEKHDPGYRQILIITDGVFSMDGDIAPLAQDPFAVGVVHVDHGPVLPPEFGDLVEGRDVTIHGEDAVCYYHYPAVPWIMLLRNV